MTIEKPVNIHEPSRSVSDIDEFVQAYKADSMVVPLVCGAGLTAYPEFGEYAGHPTFWVKDVKVAFGEGINRVKAPDHGQGESQVPMVTCQVNNGTFPLSVIVKINGREAERRVYSVKSGVKVWIEHSTSGDMTLCLEYPK